MLGHANFANTKNTMEKANNIHITKPDSGRNRFMLWFFYVSRILNSRHMIFITAINYNTIANKHTMIARNVAPSIKAAATIMLERMSPAASG